MKLPESLSENIKDRFAVLLEAVPRYGSSVDPDTLLDEITARERLAEFMDADLPTAITITRERLTAESESLDRELRAELFALGFAAYGPSVPAIERPGRWGGFLQNSRIDALTRSLRTLDEFERVDAPKARREAENATRNARQRLARMRIANAN